MNSFSKLTTPKHEGQAPNPSLIVATTCEFRNAGGLNTKGKNILIQQWLLNEKQDKNKKIVLKKKQKDPHRGSCAFLANR